MENWEKYKPKNFEFVGGWVRNWFSNMALSTIIVEGYEYASVENYYQACKALTATDHHNIRVLNPSQSKRAGRTVNIRSDWEEIKYTVMLKALAVKFNQPYWKELLLATGDEVIIEWNNWNDKIWGVSIKDSEGQNLLGKALMAIREEIKNT